MMMALGRSPYPWLDAEWQALTNPKSTQPLLFEGHPGIGVVEFVHYLGSKYLCLNPQGLESCGQCQACRLDAWHGGHPDAVCVEPTAKGKQIGIQQIRELEDFLHSKPQISNRKVVLLGPLENLNLNAANALLKSLEEPIANLHFLLWTHQPAQLLPTLISRCQRRALWRPDRSLVTTWLSAESLDRTTAGEFGKAPTSSDIELALNLAGDWPLTALETLLQGQVALYESYIKDLQHVTGDNPDWMTVAERWAKLDLHNLDAVLSWLAAELQGLIEGKRDPSFSLKGPFAASGMAVEAVYQLLVSVQSLRSNLKRGQNFLNLTMQLTAFLVDWRQLVNKTQ